MINQWIQGLHIFRKKNSQQAAACRLSFSNTFQASQPKRNMEGHFWPQCQIQDEIIVSSCFSFFLGPMICIFHSNDREKNAWHDSLIISSNSLSNLQRQNQKHTEESKVFCTMASIPYGSIRTFEVRPRYDDTGVSRTQPQLLRQWPWIHRDQVSENHRAQRLVAEILKFIQLISSDQDPSEVFCWETNNLWVIVQQPM